MRWATFKTNSSCIIKTEIYLSNSVSLGLIDVELDAFIQTATASRHCNMLLGQLVASNSNSNMLSCC